MTDRRSGAPQATCPEPGVLASYLENRLNYARRREVESHVADCAVCRETLVDSAELLAELAPANTVPFTTRAVSAPIPRRPFRAVHVLALAASLALVTWAGWAWFVRATPDLVGLRVQVLDSALERPFEARFSGMHYAPPAPVLRSAAPQQVDPATRASIALVEEQVAPLRTADARAVLALALAIDGRLDEARQAIDAAIAADASRAAWHADRAAILIAIGERGDRSAFDEAVRAADLAIAREASNLAALFNRALALEGRADRAAAEAGPAPTQDALVVAARAAAIEAWTRYFAADASSPWASEARVHIERLRSSAPPT